MKKIIIKALPGGAGWVFTALSPIEKSEFENYVFDSISNICKEPVNYYKCIESDLYSYVVIKGINELKEINL